MNVSENCKDDGEYSGKRRGLHAFSPSIPYGVLSFTVYSIHMKMSQISIMGLPGR